MLFFCDFHTRALSRYNNSYRDKIFLFVFLLCLGRVMFDSLIAFISALESMSPHVAIMLVVMGFLLFRGN